MGSDLGRGGGEQPDRAEGRSRALFAYLGGLCCWGGEVAQACSAPPDEQGWPKQHFKTRGVLTCVYCTKHSSHSGGYICIGVTKRRVFRVL